VALFDLGDAEAIDQHIRAYHEAIQDSINVKPELRLPPFIETLEQPLQALYGLIMEPLLTHLQDRRQLFISPDGDLNLIPFEAFITPGGRYLLEDGYAIHYVAAGRDIARFKDISKPQAEALIMADPDYKMGDSELIEVAKSLGLKVQEEPGVLSQEDRAMSFEGLEGSGKQAEEIRKLMGGVIYSEKKAIQEVLLEVRYPRVLHIATHGYYLPVKKIPPQFSPGKTSLPSEVLKAYENPMLRSGIALAGANTSLRGRVNAEKVSRLRLKGTELVVLSACQTGVGEVQTGEGVFGLKRAFILSGARTVVMSLWSVPSQETTELMKSFYTKWAKEKKTKAEALREAKLELMKDNRNPFFWGAFVMVGDPGK
jgi:CHAT domain-containing protein